MNAAVDCCGGIEPCETIAQPGSCARCGGELAAWTMARNTVVYCSWYCWHLDSPPEEPLRAEEPPP